MDKRTVLFVDDEEEVLRSIKRQFRREEFAVLTARGGEEALNVLQEQKIPVIISDERMPRMDGCQLLHKVRELSPDTVRIILSGYADTNSIINAINQGEVYRFVSKPWSKDYLMEIINQSFTQYEVNKSTRNYMKKIIDENRKLQRELDSRKCPLELTLKILNKISAPILAVNEDERIETFNRQAESLYRERIQPGILLEDQFPESIRTQIIEGLKLPGGRTSFNIELDGKRVKVYTRALRHQDPYRGLIIFETQEGESDDW